MSSPEEHTFQSKNTKFFQIEFSKERAVSSRETGPWLRSFPGPSLRSAFRLHLRLPRAGFRQADWPDPPWCAHAQRGVVLWFAGEAKDKT